MVMCVLKLVHGCRAACLSTAGRGKFSNVKEARLRKTKLFFEDRATFLKQLEQDIALFAKYCEQNKIKAYVRLNGTSDISWEKYGIFEKFPQVQFYDYTKVHNRKVSHLSNYHLTYSRSEDSSDADLTKALNSGMNVAVVFHKELPVKWVINSKEIPVINGDTNDLRPLDPKQSIVGLVSKGDAKKDSSGFVIYC